MEHAGRHRAGGRRLRPGERARRRAGPTLVGNPAVEGYVEHAIEATEGIAADARAALRARRSPTEGYRVLAGVEAARPLLGVTEILPAGRLAA